jgi:CRP-like cAMP-binding protein
MNNIQDILKLAPNANPKSYKKGEIIQRAGDFKTSPVYVKKGLLKSYLIDSKGKEHIYMFAPENWIIGDLEAIQYQQPAQLFIECLEDSEVITFEKDCLFNTELDKEHLAENAQVLYRRIGRLQRRVLMLMGAPAADRYLYFLETYPELPNRIPQRMIASYLGITPQALSTIRGKLTRSH